MIIYPIYHLPDVIPIGVQTENGVKEIGFNVSGWLDRWPELQLHVWVRRPTEKTSYPAVSTLEGNVLVWYVSEADTAIAGEGTVEIEGTVDDEIRVLTGEIPTEVRKTSRQVTGDPPDPFEDWYNRLMQKIDEMGGSCIVTATIGEALTETQFSCTFDKTGAEVVEALKAGQSAMCLLSMNEETVDVFPVIDYKHSGFVNYQMSSGGLTVTIRQNADNSGSVLLEQAAVESDAVVRSKVQYYLYATLLTGETENEGTVQMDGTFAEAVAAASVGKMVRVHFGWPADNSDTYTLPLVMAGANELIFESTRATLVWKSDDTATWKVNAEVVTDQAFYTADGSIFQTVDDAVLYVKKGE